MGLGFMHICNAGLTQACSYEVPHAVTTGMCSNSVNVPGLVAGPVMFYFACCSCLTMAARVPVGDIFVNPILRG